MKSIARLLGCSTIIPFVSYAPVYAQGVALTDPPERNPVDENGINFATGGIELDDPGVTIGSPGASGLQHKRTWVGNGWRHNFFMTLTFSGNVASINIGGNATKFTMSNGIYTQDIENGSKLVSQGELFLFTMSDGTVVTFDKTPINYNSSYYGYVGAVATRINLVSGEIIDLHYKASSYLNGSYYQWITRLQSVKSSSGYQLKFYYGSNALSASTQSEWSRISEVKGINNGVDYCDPAADTCPSLTRAWPFVSYALSSSGSNKLESVSGPLNRIRQFTIDSQNRMIAVKRPGSSTDYLTVTYGGTLGYVSTVVRDGHTRTYQWSTSQNGARLHLQSNDSLSRWRSVIVDTTSALVIRDQNPTSTVTVVPDSVGRPQTISRSSGPQITFEYDSRGNVTSRSISPRSGFSTPAIITSATFPANCNNIVTCNKPTTTTDELSRVTNYYYDPNHGGITRIVRPAPSTGAERPDITFSYSQRYARYKDATGSIVNAAAPIYKLTGTSECSYGADPCNFFDRYAGRQTTIGYGTGTGLNNLLPTSRIVSATGLAETKFQYDSTGNLSSIDGPLANDTVYMRYGAERQRVGVIGPDPDGAGPLARRATKVVYNSDGKVTEIIQGTVAGTSDSDWGALAYLQRQVSSYDAAGRLKSSWTDLNGEAKFGQKKYEYDAVGRLRCEATEIYQPGAEVSACALNGVTNRITRYGYNQGDQLVSVTSGLNSPEQAIVQYSYTPTGKLSAMRDAKGYRTGYTYDGFDRLTKTLYPVPNQQGSTSSSDYDGLIYDAASNVTQVRRRDGQIIDLAYDRLNRLVLKNLPGSEPDVSMTYNYFDQLLSASSAVATNSFSYDDGGRLTSQTSPQGTVRYGYDDAGQRISMAWPDGTTVNYDRLVTGDISQIRLGSTMLAAYTYDNLGRRTGISRGNGTTTSYGYDNVSRLTAMSEDLAGTASDQSMIFESNLIGQIVSRNRSNDAYAWANAVDANRAYVTNGLNQYIASGSTSVTYDGRGNLTSAGPAVYGYNSENMLVSASGSPAVSLSYDPMGRLYRIAAGAGTRFNYDGADLISEYNDSNALLRRYVHGPGSDEPIVVLEGSGTNDLRWLHADERGSIVAISNASGAATAINTYDEFGIPGTSNTGRFQFTGQVWLSELGMYNYKARIYSPTLGRFLQPDPIGYADGPNLYAYAAGDPVNNVDPSGLSCAGGPNDGTIYACGGGGGYDFPGFPWPYYDYGQWSPPMSGGSETSAADGADITVTGRRPKARQWGAANLLQGVVSDNVGSQLSQSNQTAQPDDIVVTAQRFLPRVGPPPSIIFARPPWWVRPPGWNQNWRWGPSRIRPGKSGQEPRWISPKGEEWRYHPADKHHPKSHWDYHPGTNPRAPWENRPLTPSPGYMDDDGFA